MQLVQEVELVFQNLDNEIAAFQTESGLHCKSGCGRCCLKPDIEATILEFLPFAYYQYKQGTALEYLEKINATESAICTILDPTRIGIGHCTAYAARGLICRLFGFSARTTKYGIKELVTCNVIKTEQPEEFLLAQASTITGNKVPTMNHFYMQLHGIDRELSQKYYPINIAIKKALETVLHYFSYREDLDVTTA